MAGIVESLKILLTADSSGAVKELKKTERALKKLERDFRDVAQAAGFMGAALVGVGTLLVREAAKYDRAVSGAVKRMSSAYSAMAIEVGRALLPVLRALGDALSVVTNAVRGMDPKTKELVGTILALVAALSAALAGGTGMYAMFLKLLPIIAPLAGTLLMVVAAIAAIIAVTTVLRAAWDNNWFGIKETVLNSIEQMSEGFKTFWGFLKSGFKTIANIIVIASLMPVRRFLEGIVALIDKLPEKLKPAGVGNTLGAIAGTLRSMESRGIDGMFSDAADGFDILLEKGKPVAAQLKDAFIANLTDVKKFIAGLMPDFNTQTPSPGMSLAARDSFKAKDFGGPNFSSNMPQKVGRDTVGTLAHITDFARDNLRGLGVAAKNSGIALGAAIGGIGSVLANFVTSFSDIFKDNPLEEGDLEVDWGNFWGAIMQLISEILQAADGFDELIKVAAGALKSIAGNLSPLLGALQTFVAAVGVVLEAVFTYLSPLFESLAQVITDLAPLLQIVAISLVTIMPAVRLISTILDALSPVLMVLFEGFKWITVALLWLASRLVEFANTVMSLFNIGGVFDAMIAENNRIISENNAAIDNLSAMSFVSAKAANDEAAARYANMDIMQEQNKTIQEVTESLTNVPAGYKINAARFAADGAGTFGPDIMSDRTKLNPNILVTVNVGGKAVAAEVETQMSYKAFQRTGGVIGPYGRR